MVVPSEVTAMDDELVERIVEYAISMNPDPSQSIDWDDFLLRVEQAFDIDLPDTMTDPTIRRIQREVRKARRQLD